ncbi:MAG TPA: glycosyltransferase family 39 protein [Chloroflexia bacterium]|nr:glycosyltransferase family 39 protein [Chloroflexia bacterium]
MTSSRKGVGKANTRSSKTPASLHAPAEKSQLSPASKSSRADTLFIPLAFAGVSFVIYLITRAGFHTFDGIAYIRDIGKPLSALVLPHHLIYEPTVLGFNRVWQAFGWTGEADAPAQMISSLAGAGGLALFYKLAWEWSHTRILSLIATLALALTYGYWFYSVEVDIYLPPLFFMLLAAWFLSRAVQGGEGGSAWHFYLIGLAHAIAVLIHQAALFIVPAFALGVWLIPGGRRERLLRVIRYIFALVAVVVPVYLFAGVVIAGQDTPDTFLKWINSYGNLGTWGALRADTAANTLSGLSAAVSADFWTGRVLVIALFASALALARHSIRRGGPFAWALWVWTGIYLAFFAWWQPDVLKFWVLVLPAPLLLLAISLEWERLARSTRVAALSASGFALAVLLLTNAPEIWAKRDPMSDPARRMSDALWHLTGPEDLIVLQASGAEHYLPFYYGRINIMSTRELWYLLGGAKGNSAAIDSIKQRAWHALAKGESVWIEDRVLTSGQQAGDHYVFRDDEVKTLLDLYGEPATPEQVTVGPATFYKFSPTSLFSKSEGWQFSTGQSGWSGVNVNEENFKGEGWCFAPMQDPSLYGPPLKLDASQRKHLEISMSSGIGGKAQLFYRDSPEVPYAEEKSVMFDIVPGEQIYSIDLADAPGWTGTIAGLRLDPVEAGIPSSQNNRVCVREVHLLP